MNDRRLRQSLGMSPLAICALAALAAPRVIAHDLGPVSPALNSVLVWVPLVVWLVVVLWRRVPNAFVTLLAVGVVYGVLLAVTHQILWAEAFDGAAPSLGGNLAESFSPTVEAVVLRGFSVVSSLVTGALVGVVTGIVGWLLARFVPALRPLQHTRSRDAG
ncbi:MAG TPA: hypothetical protein VK053_03005 [Jiangellaceae bacterium]|nr:hypothetical protein [Jiangellaceae bacterium]